MAKRKLRVVNSDNQLFCVCEACSASFKSLCETTNKLSGRLRLSSTRTSVSCKIRQLIPVPKTLTKARRQAADSSQPKRAA